MTSVKIKFRPSTVAGKKGVVYYQLIHDRIVRHINTSYRIFATEWDERSGSVIYSSSAPGAQRWTDIRFIQNEIKSDTLLLDGIVSSLELRGVGYTTDDIVNLFYERVSCQSFLHFGQKIVLRLEESGRIRTSEIYKSALRSFMRFRKGRDIRLSEITAEQMALYADYLSGEGVSLNTNSFYMRVLRAIYNRAVEEELVMQSYPFRAVYTGVEKTLKRSIPFEVLKRIKKLDLSLDSSLDFARDVFLFSFYTRGMSFVDISYLRKGDIQDGVLRYRRKKTGQRLFIRWEKCMQEIIDKYAQSETDYLLPIIRLKGNERRQYINALHLVNRRLKDLSRMINYPVSLTMYVARHSWASVAKSKNIPLSVISESMGHDSENTTLIYLASLDNSVIDNANRQILQDL